MSLQTTLKNPLDRVDTLTNTMNWRGDWDAETQYFKNDVAISTDDRFAYILVEKTTIKDGIDPSVSPDWVELGSASTGIKSIIGVAGLIAVELIPKQVSINNTGITKINSGYGIVNSGTDQDLKLSTTTPAIIISGNSGINLTGTIILGVENKGIIAISNGGGLNIIRNGSDVKISNNLVDIQQSNGIEVTKVDNDYTISNTGIITFDIVGNGLVNNGTATEPIIESTSVKTVSILPNGNLILNGGDAQIILLSSNNADIGGFGSNVAFIPPTSIIPTGIKTWVTTTGGAQWNNYFQNGAPDPNGIFIVDFTQWVWGQNTDGIIGADEELTMYMGNSENSALYAILNATINLQVNGGYTMIVVGNVYININQARQAGNFYSSTVHFQIQNNTGISWTSQAKPIVNSVYYPNGII